MNTATFRHYIFSTAAIGYLLLPHADALAITTGKVQFVDGNVTVTAKDQTPRPVKKGLEINEGDLIATGPASMIQALMADGTVIALRANSQIRIASYRSGSTEEIAHAMLDLLRGAVREITTHTRSGKSHDYQIRTPITIVGIRGTDHETFYVLPTKNGKTDSVKPGVYDHVFKGGTFMKNAKGTLNLEAGQIGFVSDANSLPVILNVVPSFMAPDVKAKQSIGGVTDQTTDKLLSGSAPGSLPAAPTLPAPVNLPSLPNTPALPDPGNLPKLPLP